MSHARRSGFTLIELLTVIAIIAILAGITFSVLPRMLESAKIRRLTATMNEIRTAMTQYAGDNNGYPPGYGYIAWDMRQREVASLSDEERSAYFFLKPYTAFINIHGNEKMYDEFSLSGDMDQDGRISRAEYIPMGRKDIVTERISFPTELYTGSNDPDGSEGMLLDADKRPFAYFPVNLRQFKKARRYWVEHGDYLAEHWNGEEMKLIFPPAKYDAYVLISVGPGGRSYGVVPEVPDGLTDEERGRDVYHILGLRAFFLATRDLNDNGLLDFHFEARAKQGEAQFDETNPYTVKTEGDCNNNLPDPANQHGYGPYIYVVR